MTPEPLILAKSVGVTFAERHAALRNVDLAIPRGAFVSLVGPSACGKSTLLRLIAGLLKPTAGELSVAGARPGRAIREAHRVSFVFQDATLLPWRNVRENIRLPFELDRRSTEGWEAAIDESLRLIGLTVDDADKFPRMLSGGMRMRVSLARALVTHPDILLLDEPFGALDDILRQQLNEELLRIWAATGWTGLFVTHNVSEAVFLSQRVLVMGRAPGSIVAEIDVPFQYPRPPELRADARFARIAGDVSAKLREALQ